MNCLAKGEVGDGLEAWAPAVSAVPRPLSLICLLHSPQGSTPALVLIFGNVVTSKS